jgi:hypothetical protein
MASLKLMSPSRIGQPHITSSAGVPCQPYSDACSMSWKCAQPSLSCITSDRLTSHVQCTLEYSLATLNTPVQHPPLTQESIICELPSGVHSLSLSLSATGNRTCDLLIGTALPSRQVFNPSMIPSWKSAHPVWVALFSIGSRHIYSVLLSAL